MKSPTKHADVPAGDVHQRPFRGRAPAGVSPARRRHQPGRVLRGLGGRTPAHLPRGRGVRGGGGSRLLTAQVQTHVEGSAGIVKLLCLVLE